MKARQLPPYEELSRDDRERLFEHDLPVYLQHDLDAFKDGLEYGSPVGGSVRQHQYCADKRRRNNPGAR